MKFTFAHNNFNVVDLEKSLKFYEEALNLHEVRRKEAAQTAVLSWFIWATGHRLPAGADLPQGLGEGEL